MIRLAVVGDIGSGKSYVARQFGCPVFNADVEVAKLYKTNKVNDSNCNVNKWLNYIFLKVKNQGLAKHIYDT